MNVLFSYAWGALLSLTLLGGCQNTSPVADSAAAHPKLESLQALSKTAPVTRKLDIQSWKTPEGARVMFVEANELPMYDLRLTFAAGSSQDGNTPGIATTTNGMLNEGIAGMDTTAIAIGFENLGANFSNGAYRDMAVAGLRTLSDPTKSGPALDLFTKVVGHPTFPAAPLERIRNQLLTSIEYKKQDPGAQAGDALMKQLYGSHPYAHPSMGTAESLRSITPAQLRAFHQRAYTAGNVVIALTGNLTRPQAEAIAAKVSRALPKGPALPSVAKPQPPKPGVTHIEFPSQQTHLMLAEQGIDRRDPDYAALYLGNQILGGGGFGTRLMTEVREKRGLTYGVYSGFTPMQVAGPFTIGLQTRAEMSQNTLGLVQNIVRQYLKEGPTQKELDDAKREISGSFPLSTASNSAIVAQLGMIGFYDLPLDFLDTFMKQTQALTTDQVREAMARHLNPDGFVIVTAGPTVAQQPLPAPVERGNTPPPSVPEH
ncbi:pitrilysin family protein [Pseudomonas sp.]|uniref:M16 family metallopeptidase n=1 Tax=Pseudomonas sp. TaxID=306 RepID=UPI00289CEB1E|nr:pitrilysin family protein [Pseudomonas sp.]